MTFLSDSKSYLSPLVGYAAKNTGLLYNLRFFGNYTPGYDADGNRSYANDRTGDRVWSIVRILFPSTGGGLTTSSEAAGSFGKNITDTKPISALLALIMRLRKMQFEVNELNAVATEQFQRGDREGREVTKGTLKTKFSEMRQTRDEFKNMFPLEEYKQLCEHVFELMTNPGASLIKLGYPEFLLEQIFVGFIMVHFNGAQEYVNDLPEDFFASTNHPMISKIRDFVQAMEDEKYPTAFGRFTRGAINNGSAKIFDRTNGTMLKQTFADCCETAARHLCTLLLWDAKTQRIRPCANKEINEFYALFTPNDGSILARSRWNAIVGDLNVGIDGPRVAYENHEHAECGDRAGHAEHAGRAKLPEYDLNGSIENYALILMRIFKLETPDHIKTYRELVSKSDVPKLQQFMSKIFNLISPNKYKCVFHGDFSHDAYYGDLVVTFRTSGTVIFTLTGMEDHGEVNIRSEGPKAPGEVEDAAEETEAEINGIPTVDIASDDEAEDGAEDEFEEDDDGELEEKFDLDFDVGEVLPKELPSSFQAFRALGFPVQQNLFYARMCLNLRSNVGIINYLKTILHFSPPNATFSESQSFRNALAAFSWDDYEMCIRITAPIVNLAMANIHMSDLRGRIDNLAITSFEHLDAMKILGIQKTGILFLSRSAFVSNVRGVSTLRKGDWIIECAVHNLDNRDDRKGRENFIMSIEIPSYIREIGDNFLSDNRKLQRVEIPHSVTRIGSAFLSFCPIKSIRIPSSVVSIGQKFMWYCNFLETVIIEGPISFIDDSFLSTCESLRCFEIPSTVTAIGDSFLSECPKLEYFEVPDSVITIGKGLLKYCRGLKRLKLSNAITTISESFLYLCSGLRHVEIPNSVTEINEFFLYACASLQTIKLSSSLESIGDNFMCRCEQLKVISFPKSVTRIGRNAMMQCDELEKVKLSGAVHIGNYFLEDSKNLKEVSLAGFETDIKIICKDGSVHVYPRGTVLTEASFPSEPQVPFHTIITKMFSNSEVNAVDA